MTELIRYIQDQWGITNAQLEIGFQLGILLLLFLLLLMYAARRRTASKHEQEGFSSITRIRGRLERLEKTLNEVKTEVSRANELNRIEFSFIRGELRDLKHKQGLADLPSDPAPIEPPFESPLAEQKKNLAPESKRSETIDSSAAEVEAAVSVPQEISQPSEHLAQRLVKTRRGLLDKIRGIFGNKSGLDLTMIEEFEATLIAADLGIKTVTPLINELGDLVRGKQTITAQGLREALSQRLQEVLQANTTVEPRLSVRRCEDGPMVVMLVGVNGSGKTTTAAKLAHRWQQEGSKVLLVAADTFRAAAVDQLCAWGSRLGVSVLRGLDNAKPQTVVYEAMEQAAEGGFDVVIIDTAGRLHTKGNLMQELQGIRNVIQKRQSSAPHETILVVDGLTGQNAVSQAREFHEAVPLTGLVVTKLDGTSKGGVVVAIKSEVGIPVHYIGLGEQAEDLQPFNVERFVKAILEEDSDQ